MDPDADGVILADQFGGGSAQAVLDKPGEPRDEKDHQHEKQQLPDEGVDPEVDIPYRGQEKQKV